MKVMTKKALVFVVLASTGLAGVAMGSGAFAGSKPHESAVRAAWTVPAEQQNVKTLPLDELDKRVRARGFQVKELKVKGLILEVEGIAKDGREHKFLLDRRSGDVLAQKIDD